MMNSPTNNIIQNNDEIDLKDIFKTILRYKYSIIFLTIVFTFIAAVFAYIKPNIYTSSATIEIQKEEKGFSKDALKEAFSGGGANVDNQIEVFKSRFLTQKALEYLDLNTRYFTVKNYRKREYYQNSPFVVGTKVLDDIIYGKTFILTPIDENSFNLKINPVSKFSKKGILNLLKVAPLEPYDLIAYDKNHKYNEDIVTQWFTISVEKISTLKNKTYEFNFVHPEFANEIFYKDLSIGQVSKFASVLELSIQDANALRAKDLLNALFKAYLTEEIKRKSEVANLSLKFIDGQLDEINKRLKVSESNLESYKESNDVINLPEKATITSQKITEYEAKLQEISIEENVLQTVKQYLNSNQNTSGLTVGSVSFADPALASLIKRLHELSTEKDAMLIDYTEIHPDVEKLSKTIASLRRSIKASLRSNLKQLQQRKYSLRTLINKYTKSLETLPKQERELTRLARHFNVNEKVYSYLLEKRAETAILKSSTISNARVLDEAVVYPKPIKPKRTLIVLVGFILGAIIGIILAFLREFMNNTVKNSDEIEKLSSIPMYGIIPNNKNKKSKKLADEAYRAIRTNLQFLPKHERSEVIAITSSVSGEGKTTTASNLAKIVAQTGKSVAILDLDLRKASLHKEFNIPNNVGISNYLTGQNSFDEIKNSIEGNENLDVFTTGTLPPNPSELILTDEMKNFIEKLKDDYDYVIFDTPPVGLVTDAMILMNYADISFVIVRASYTRKEFVKNLDRLSKEHSQNTFGMILNGVEIGEKYGYGYGSNYGYGYGNDKYYKNR